MHPAAVSPHMNTNTSQFTPFAAHQQQAPGNSLLTSAMLAARYPGDEGMGGLTQQGLISQMLAAQSPAPPGKQSMELLSSELLGAARFGATQPLPGSAGSLQAGSLAPSQFMMAPSASSAGSSSLGLPMGMRQSFQAPQGCEMSRTEEKQTVESNGAEEPSEIARGTRVDERTRRLIVKNSFLHLEDSESDKEEEIVECNSSVRSSSMPSSVGRETRLRNLPSADILQMLARFNSAQTSMASTMGQCENSTWPT